jgi:hypothetical protein
MSKKKPQKRKPKEISKPRDADGLRELAGELTELAQRLETYADGMEAMGIASIRPLTGNFHLAVERIRIFTAQQVLARLVTEATRQGRDAHEVLGRG